MAAFGTAEYWRERASKAREYLETVSDPQTRADVEEIIQTYDRLAKEAENHEIRQ